MLLSILAIVVGVAVIVIPLAVVGYPPMTDLPFHAAMTATLRHYNDPTYRFHEQFEWTPIAVPYLALYAVGAALMVVLPPLAAVKAAVALFLALVPIGLAVLCHGLKKSPLLGALGLLVVWGPLTHWGFINFVGAIGLFAMTVGLALLTVDRPTTARRALLSAVLCALFFTHIFRFPIAIVAVLGVALVMATSVRQVRSVLLPLLPPLALLAIWMVRRPPALKAPMGPLTVHLSRLRELDCLTGSFDDPEEGRALFAAGLAIAAFLLLRAAAPLLAPEAEPPSTTPGWRVRATIVAAGAVLGSLLLYLVLPMQIGDWWYVYPREATTAVFLAFALVPDLPRAPVMRAALMGLVLAAPIPTALVVARNYAAFDAETRDFAAITRSLPQAPRLLYLIFDHEGSTRRVSPFTHLPAWVQAEKGGWLSHHFTTYGATPMRYRDRAGREDIIPPPTPPAWEWHPEAFDVLERGRFFDWFLVRASDSPAEIFAPDPSITEARREGKWWLYARRAEDRREATHPP